MTVLTLAESVCDQHDARKNRESNPEYLEVQLLEACMALRKHEQESKNG